MDYAFLADTPLFAGAAADEIRHMMACLRHGQHSFRKGQRIYSAGETVTDVCLVLSGSVQIEHIDVLGNKSILDIAEAGDIFAESYACLPEQPLLVDVSAREDAEILCIHIPSLFSESAWCEHSARLLQNLLRISSRKNLRLSMRISHTTPKMIRARLYSYFSEQIALQGTSDIRIPLNREQLADYLSVDRTALSKELGKMKREGLLDYRKNYFRIFTQ